MDRFKVGVMAGLVILSLSAVGLWIKQNQLAKSWDLFIISQSLIPKASLMPSPSLIPNPTSEPSPSLIPSPSPSPSSVFTPDATVQWQPQNIYLGSASTTKTEWTETSAAIQLNSNDYPSEVKAVFEAQLSIVNGEAWARLKNKTSGAIMQVTEIFNNSNTATWKNSPAFKLHSGTNTYVIELKSTTGEQANLSGARLKLSL
jgi:hypothetical protein